MFPVITLVILLIATPAAADWTVTYFTSGTVQQVAPVVPNGSYELVRAPEFIPVYLLRDNIWDFIGMYGAPAFGQPQAVLSSSFPAITFPGTSDVAFVVGAAGFPVSARALATPALQRATAWSATTVLRALGVAAVQQGLSIDLPSRRYVIAVHPQCVGIELVLLCLFLAASLAVAVGGGAWWQLAFIVMAAGVAVEANVLRVAATAVTFETLGESAWAWKDQLGMIAMVFAFAQVIWLGWLMSKAELMLSDG
jgi:exosortase/archaeosortase family protein